MKNKKRLVLCEDISSTLETVLVHEDFIFIRIVIIQRNKDMHPLIASL